MSLLRAGFAALLIATLIPAARAGWPASSFSAVQLSDSTDAHTYPMVFPDGTGGAVVTYFADSANFSRNSIMAQRVDAAGTVQWGTNGVQAENSTDNIVYNEWTKAAAIVSDGNGGIIAVYKRGLAPDENIYAQRITAAGVPAWGADSAIVTAAETQQAPTAIPDGMGGAFIAWQDNRSDANGDIYMQRIDANGIRLWNYTGVAVCTVMNGQSKPVLCSDGAGGVIVAWSDQRRSAYDVYAQRLDAAGSAVWPDSGVELYHDNEWMDHIPCVLTYGGQGKVLCGFIAPASTERYLKAQRIDTSGVLDWSASGTQLSYSMGIANLTVLPDSAGGAVYVWDDQVNWPEQVYAQRVDAAGSTMWGANIRLSDGSDKCFGPAAVEDSAGMFTVVWADSSDTAGSFIKAQRIDLNGSTYWRTGGEFVAESGGGRNNPSLAAVAPGKCIVAWQDSRNGWTDIYAQQLPVPEPVHNVYNVMSERYYTTLAEALDTNACSYGDFIVLLKDTVYTGNFVVPDGVGLMADTTLTNRPTISGGGSGVVVRMGDDTEIHGVRIVNSDTCGLLFDYLSMATCEVTDCEIDSCGTEFGVPAIIVNESYNVTFINNVIHERNSGVDSTFCVRISGMSMGTRFYNNTFLGEYWGGIEVDVSSSTEDVHVFNNLFAGFGNGAGGAAVRNAMGGTASLYVKNNVFTGNYLNVDFWNTPMMLDMAANCNWGNDSSVVDTLGFIADPRFADSAAGDFRLGQHSPCIDAGVALDSVANMYFGIDADGSPIDIGPFGGPLADEKNIPAWLDAFAVINGGGFDTLTWTPSSDAQFLKYCIYRDTTDAGFIADTSTYFDSSTTQGAGGVVVPDGSKSWYYRINVVTTAGYAGGYRTATGHAPEVASISFDDNMSTAPWDDTITVVFTAPLDTAGLSMMPLNYFSVYGGLLTFASLSVDPLSDTVLYITLANGDFRPDSLAVRPGQLFGANGVEVLDTDPEPVLYAAPYVTEAWYHDSGTNAFDDDILTVILSTPVADTSVDTNFSGAYNDFVFYGGMQTATTTKIGAANDETLFVHMGAGDMPPYALRAQPFGLWDTTGMHPSTDTLPVLVKDISPARPDSVWPAAYTAQAVDMWASIGAHFSRAMDPGTIDTSSFTVTGDLRGRYAGTVGYTSWNRTASFSATNGLWYGDRITCRLTTAIHDSLGDPLKHTYEWSFRVQEWSSNSDTLGHDPYVRIPLNGDTVKAAVWADIDRNGYPDLVVAVDNRPNRIYFNTGGTLDTTKVWYSLPANRSYDVAVGDINGDGWQDLVFANYQQPNTVYLGGPDSIAAVPAWDDGFASPTYAVALADIDGNGMPDLLTGEYNDVNRVYFDSSGVFKQVAGWVSDQSDYTCDVAAADLNGDGMSDIVYGNNLSRYNRAYLNEKGVPAPTASWEAGAVGNTQRIILEDIDLDGTPDLVCADNGQNMVYLNDGSTFLTTPSWTSVPGNASYAVGVIDKEYDNDRDLVFVNHLGQAVMYQNDGGALNSSPVWFSNVNVHEGVLALGDYDRDGDKDMVCVDSVSGIGRHLALFYNGNTPPVLGNFRASHDTAGRALTGPGYRYIEFDASDLEGDSLALNDGYFSVGDSSSWNWLTTVGSNGFQLVPGGSTYVLTWNSRNDMFIESDSVWVRISLWDPVGSYVSGYYYGGPFAVDNQPPLFGDSLTVIGSTDSSVTLQWGMAPDANFDRYEIWYDSSGSVYRDNTDSLWGPAKDPALTNASTVTTTITGLRSGMSYGFRIWAYDSLGNDTSISAGPLFVYTDPIIDGYVTDTTGTPIPGAQVTLVDTGWNRLDTVMTDAAGRYVFNKLKMFDTYYFFAKAPGFEGAWFYGEPDSSYAFSFFCDGDTTLDTAFLVPPPLFQPVLTGMDSISSGNAAWADYDGDGDLDVVLCGDPDGAELTGQTVLYRNDGGNVFSDAVAGLASLYHSNASWCDYDNDNDPDLVLSGDMGSFSPAVYLYRNDSGVFNLVSAGLIPVMYSASSWADYDNDGDPDLFITGQGSTRDYGVLYRNEGADSFSIADSALMPLRYASASWADYDADGDPDLLVTGDSAGTGNPVTVLYRNDAGTLVDAGIGFAGVFGGNASWGDYDNDGDPDILMTGSLGGSSPVSMLYRNDGGPFVGLDVGLDSVYDAAAAWIDIDGDGWLDIVQSGYHNTLNQFAEAYRNEGGTSFVSLGAGLEGLNRSSVTAGDFNNDGSSDLMITGYAFSGYTVTNLLLNTLSDSNTAPLAPPARFAIPSPETTFFMWQPAADSTTPSPALSYNVAVGTSPVNFDVVSPMADPGSGYRYLPAAGNAGCDTSFMLLNLSPGRYYWKVQAIDHSFAGGAFTAVDSFDVVIDTVGPQLVSAEYRSYGTQAADDDSLFVTFDEPVLVDSMNLVGGGAGSDFDLSGRYAHIANASITYISDTVFALTFAAADTILSHNRADLLLPAGASYDYAGNPSAADTVKITTRNVRNINLMQSYRTIDEAEQAASAGHTIQVLDEGLYTEALNIGQDLTIESQGWMRPEIRYAGSKAGGSYLIYCYNFSGVDVDIRGFDINGIHVDGSDTVAIIIYADGGSIVDCDIHGTGGFSANPVIRTTNNGNPASPLVIDSCRFYDIKHTGIEWSKRVSGSAVTNCSFWDIRGGSSPAISGMDADSTVISHNVVDSVDMGIYFGTGCDDNLVAMNLITKCNYGLNIGVSAAGMRNRFLFNTIHGCATTGIRIGTDPSAPDTVMYNIAYNNSTDLDTISTRHRPAADYNCYGTAGGWLSGGHAVNADPLFTDAANKDFSLQTGSPVIGISGVDSLAAHALELRHSDLDGMKRPMPQGSYWDLGAFEEQVTMRDLTPPDNDMTLTVTAIDTDKVELAWTVGDIDSSDADSVDVWYRYSAGVDGHADLHAVRFAVLPVSASIDTVTGLLMDSTVHFTVIPRDTAGNYADTSASSSGSIFMYRPATWATVALTPDTVVAGTRWPFECRVLPQGGSMDELAFISPAAGSFAVDTVRVNGTPLILDGGMSHPAGGDTAVIEVIALDSVMIRFGLNRVTASDTIVISFTDSMRAVPVIDSLQIFGGHTFTGMYGCAPAVPGDLVITTVPGAVDHYLMNVDTLGQEAGLPFNLKLVAKDRFGNTVTNIDTSFMTFTLSGPGMAPDGTGFSYPGDAAIRDSFATAGADSAGMAVIPVTAYRAETCSLRFTDVLNGVWAQIDSIDVAAGPAGSLFVTPAGTTVTADDSVVFSTVIEDAWKNPLAGAPVWDGTGSKQSMTDGTYYADSTGTYDVWASYSGLSDTVSVIVGHGILTALDITPDTAVITADSVLALTAMAYDADGNTWPVSDTATGTVWTTNDSLGGTVVNGVYTPALEGVFQMYAVNGTGTDTCTVTVTHGTVAGVSVLPVTPVATADDSVLFTLTAYDANANSWDVTADSMTAWTAGGTKAVMTNGAYQADTAGVWFVAGDHLGFTDTVSVTVTNGIPVVLAITPDSAAVTADTMLQLAATVYDADGNPLTVTDSAAANWNTDDISGSVMNGLYEPADEGAWNVWADYAGVSDTCRVTVTHGTAAFVTLAPAGTTVTADAVLALNLTAADADGNTWNVTADSGVTWSGNGTMTPVAAGTYYADTAGTYDIIAVVAGRADTAVVTVMHGVAAGIKVAPALDSAAAGDTLQFAAAAFDADGNPWSIDDSVTAAWSATGTRFTPDSGRYYADTAGTFIMTTGYLGFADTSTVVTGMGTPVSMKLCHNAVSIPADSFFWFTADLLDGFGNKKNVTSDTSTVWSTDDTLAVIDPGVYYRPVRTGTYLLWAVNNGLSDTAVITVTPGAQAGLLVTPDSVSVTADSTVAFKAEAFDAENNYWDVTDSALWGTDEPAVTVAAGSYAPASVGSYAVHAAYGGFTDTAAVDVAHGAAVSLILSTGDFAITADDTMAIVLTAADADGNTWNATSTAAWTTNDTTGGTVTAGMYIPYGTGSYTLAVVYDGLADTVAATVSVGAPVELTLSDTTAAVTADSVLVLKAFVTDAKGNKTFVTGTAGWDTDDSAAVVTAGSYNPVAAGTHAVWAVDGGLSDTCMVTVTPGIPVSVTVSPATAVIEDDTTIQFTATVLDADGNAAAVAPAWSLVPEMSGTISASGFFTPFEIRDYQVICAVGTVADTASVTVIPSAAASIAIDGDSLVVVNTDTSRTFTLTARDENNNETDVRELWSVSDTTVATIDTAGVLTPLKTGTVTVTATVDTLVDQAVVTILPGTLAVFAVNETVDTITTDETKQYTVTAVDAKGNDTGLPVTWSVSDSSVGSIDSTGLFTPAAAGNVMISATVQGNTVSVSLTVKTGAVASVVIAPVPGTVTTDTIIMFGATAYDNVLTEVTGASVAWVLAGDTVGTLSDSGVFDPVRPGTAAVIARSGIAADTVQVVVVPGRPAYLVIAVPADSVPADSVLQYTAAVYDADSNMTADVPVWSVNGTLGAIGADGLFDADRDGSGYVVAAAGAAAGSVAVRVYDDIAPTVRLTMPAKVRHTSAVACTAAAADTAGHTGTAAGAIVLEYAVDGGAWTQVKAGTFTLQELSDGAHAVAVRAADAYGNVSAAVTGSVTVALAPYAAAGGYWQMLSVPMDIAGNKLASLAGADSTSVEYLYRWDENASEDVFTLKYVDVSDDPLRPGDAYWFRASADVELNFSAGDTFAAAGTPVRLLPGWNQVGNPYPFPVDWFAASVVTGTDTVSMDTALARGLLDNAQHFFSRNGDSLWYDMVRAGDNAAFTPWTGCWVKAVDTLDVLLPRTVYQGGQSATVAARNARAMSDAGWLLRLAVHSGSLRDEYNIIGMHPAAASGRDRFDACDPPVLGRYARLAMQQGGGRLACDIRPAASGITEWLVAVDVSEGGSGTVLDWDPAALPAGVQLYLYDLANGSVTDMSASYTYTFSAPAGQERLFRVVAASGTPYKPAALPTVLSVTSVTPHPVTGPAAVTFTVPAMNAGTVPVTVGVYDASGQLLRSFGSTALPAGIHRVVWDGRDDTGRSLASGTYIVRITAGDHAVAAEIKLIKRIAW